MGLHSKLGEEQLRTLITKAAHLINSCPISVVSDDINDPKPITPNHFLRSEHSILIEGMAHFRPDSPA